MTTIQEDAARFLSDPKAELEALCQRHGFQAVADELRAAYDRQHDEAYDQGYRDCFYSYSE